jgi:acetolactate synthase regulatory subunit
MTTHQLTVTVQAQLGALDRVLGAFTHRGMIPIRFEATLSDDAQTQTVLVTFRCSDEHTVSKLVGFLTKQVQVLSVEHRTVDSLETSAS